MKKNFKFYVICWAILLAVFNAVCFLIPAPTAEADKFGGAFWSGYIFITVAFIGQLVCAYIAFKAVNLKKVFYNLPMVTVSYTGLILTIIVGGVCMAIPGLPNWIGIIACLLVLAFNAITVVKAAGAAQIVSDLDDKIAEQTQFVKTATVDAQNIANRAKSDAVKAECKKVYEALRYSDPISIPALASEEARITAKMSELADVVGADDAEKASSAAAEIVLLIKERNNKCKAMKCD